MFSMRNLSFLLLLPMLINCVFSINNFSQSNFYVSFSPYVFASDSPSAYDEADLIPLIKTVSTKFSNLITEPIELKERQPSVEQIPTAVAKYNKLYNSTLKLMIVYKLENATELNGKNTTPFDIALELANRANSIHNGTVETLLLWFNGEPHTEVVNHLKLYKGEAKKYRHGIGFSTEDCGVSKNLDDDTVSILEYLQFVYINYYPKTQDEFNLGPQKSLQNYLRHFQVCREKIQILGLPIEIGIGADWPDTDFNGKQNFSALVTFWEEMNEFVIATNTTAIMFEALDNLFREPVARNEGWWKLKSENEYYARTQDFVFVEKKDLAKLESKSKPAVASTSYVGNLVSVVVTSSIMTVVVIGIAIFLVYRQMRKELGKNEVGLSKRDILEFFEGVSNSEHVEPVGPLQMEMDRAVHSSKYNNKHELKLNSFRFNEVNVLGKGNFGMVCKGEVKVNGVCIPVAVKMARKSSPPSALKGLLSEIKVLSHLGQHENIVGLIGAYTKELRRGKVLVFTELCSCGSLESYLREKAKTVKADMNEEGIEAKVMFQWSCEIASGMEFIISKDVVHADLSTRNVLLSDNLTAKISDFGLSRRLYDYISYIKKSQEPLPWRWMSPESLRRWEFTEKSDVWAFGITLWEIYSLGSLPYGGLSWSTDFPLKLMKGLRLEEPEFNTNEMYIIMLKCWNVDPERRPTFADLTKILTQNYQARDKTVNYTMLSCSTPELV